MEMKDISLKMDEYLPLRDVVFNTLRNASHRGIISWRETYGDKAS